MKKTVLAALFSFCAAFGVVTYARYASADQPITLAQGGSSAGSAVTVPPFEAPPSAPATETSAAAPAPTAPNAEPPALLTPTGDDIGVLTKLWKNGGFFAIGVIAVYLGLGVWSKLDKKHAWYAATAAGALALTIEGIRKGDTPTAMSLVAVLGPLTGVLIKGPGHA